jgi:hypothetical protein
LSPEVSGSVPGPTRVEEHGSSECGQIGVSRAENGFGLLEFSDQADGDDWEGRRLLHRPGKGNLITGAERNLLVSSMDQPPSTQSVADTRIVTGRFFGGITQAIALKSVSRTTQGLPPPLVAGAALRQRHACTSSGAGHDGVTLLRRKLGCGVREILRSIG